MADDKSPRGYNLQQGETVTLKASSALGDTAGTNGTAVYLGGERLVFTFLLDVTAAATDAADTLDVYIDWSLDDSTYINGGHFTQVLGNGGAVAYFMQFGPSGFGTADLDATADQAAGTVLPSLIGPYVRTRYVIVDGGAHGEEFTFSVIGYAQ